MKTAALLWGALCLAVVGLAYATSTPPLRLALDCRDEARAITVILDHPRRYLPHLWPDHARTARFAEGETRFDADFVHQHGPRGRELTFYLETGAYLGAWTAEMNELWLYRDATGAIYDTGLALPCR
ncbi:hypothetical protein OE810_03110 [Rhodobacteraceae bacterium XHP0102]|nr:hypothetical protein [Rhodobacteraceae bacterium XHP0102]